MQRRYEGVREGAVHMLMYAHIITYMHLESSTFHYFKLFYLSLDTSVMNQIVSPIELGLNFFIYLQL